ncbi:uncharacterized protein LOC127285491 [Leptopilina boulardi]|uniref:uncharacterized protein LOC127285491 n=1 Tax=Leptopilina boulardi TaxID=63433 RepID=UPI0021F622E5|nr:uncharacterized protein LOC127285491 [Leptopilina boulardi]
MIKFLCVLVVFFAIGYALEKKAEFTKARFIKGINYPGLTIKIKNDKTEFTWNEPISVDKNSLRATFIIKFTNLNKIESVDLDNLCGTNEKASFKESVQLFILKTIADVNTCPIKKGTQATFSVPSAFSYTMNGNLCGPFRSEMKVFRKKDNGNTNPLFTGMFEGNITGC